MIYLIWNVISTDLKDDSIILNIDPMIIRRYGLVFQQIQIISSGIDIILKEHFVFYNFQKSNKEKQTAKSAISCLEMKTINISNISFNKFTTKI